MRPDFNNLRRFEALVTHFATRAEKYGRFPIGASEWVLDRQGT
jgi:hypothetical protein